MLCASTRRQGEIIQEDVLPTVTVQWRMGYLSNPLLSKWSESFFHWTLMMKVLEDITFSTTPCFFFRAIYRLFSPDNHPFKKGCEIHTLFVWGGRVFRPVQKSGGKTPAEVSTFVKMWFWSTLLPALPVQRKTQLGVEPLQCHWVATPFCLSKKKNWPWSTSWKTQKEIKLMCFLNLIFFLDLFEILGWEVVKHQEVYPFYIFYIWMVVSDYVYYAVLPTSLLICLTSSAKMY